MGSTGRTSNKSNKNTSGRNVSKKSNSTRNASKKGATNKSRTNAKERVDLEENKIRSRVIDEICATVVIAVGIFMIAAIQLEAAGIVGEFLHDLFLGCFGILGYVLPYYLVIYGILLFAKQVTHISARSVSLIVLIFVMCALLNSARYIDVECALFNIDTLSGFIEDGINLSSGGLIGMFLGALVMKAIGKSGLIIFSLVAIFIALLLVLNTPVSQFVEKMKLKKERRSLEKELLNEDIAETLAETFVEPKVEVKEKSKIKNSEKNNEKGESDSNILKEIVKKNQYETGYVPGKINPGQKNILAYMNDDTLFADRDDEKIGQVINIAGHVDNATLTGINVVDDNTYNSDDLIINTPSGSLSENMFRDMDLGFGTSNENNEIIEDNTQTALFDSFLGNEVTESENAQIVEIDEREEISNKLEDSIELGENTEKVLTNKEAKSAMIKTSEINAVKMTTPYQMPPLDLLKQVDSTKISIDGNLRAKATKLEETLQSFHVDAKVVQVTQGPAVTRYEIQPAVGVKVANIVRLADDIALNMEAKSIRIEAPIPGKAAVGIEIENEKVNMVSLREIISSNEFKSAKSKISFAVGRDITGASVVGDLKGMPHMLIAGSTGSGKSVCINSIIMSLLYKATPDEVKLVLIDPKVVELGNYNGIPHLLIPVVTEPTKAAAALNWAVAEMTDRYRKFAESGVRDLESYNDAKRKNDEEANVLPQVVIIIDELADLMMAAPSQVQDSICRLAQMARAAGMHLIVATQRPSVDVVTGVIKANIPSRIAFAVSSQVDSRTILDMGGAEKLVGKGDMLYNPLGLGKPIRIQGTYVSDEEVNRVIEFVKSQYSNAEYSSEIISTIEKGSLNNTEQDEGDEILSDAIEMVVQSGQASASMLQRRFRIGYNRAARIIDMMEARGIIGPSDGSRPRQVLMTEAELYELNNSIEE